MVQAACPLKDGDTLEIIYQSARSNPSDAGIVRGEHGIQNLLKALNPWIRNWNKLRAGQTLSLFFPQGRVPASCKIVPQKITVDQQDYRLLYQLVYTDADNTLTDFLAERGIGGPNPKFRLYGQFGFAERKMTLNSHIKNWKNVMAGTPLIVAYPDPTPIPPPESNIPVTRYVPPQGSKIEASIPHFVPPPEVKPAPPRPVPTKPKLTKKQKAVIAKPEKAKIEDLVALPPEEIKKVDRAVIKEKLSVEKIAVLKEEDIGKIPEEVKEEKAWEFSLLDSFQSNMDKFVEKAAEKGVAGYLGLRVAQSLVYSDPLLKEARLIGLLFEGRGEWTNGLRLYIDRSSETHASTPDGDQFLAFQRILAAWAYAIKVNKFIDVIHITLRLGSYSLEAHIPADVAPNGTLILRDFKIDNALAAGLEVDVEWNSFFYILRGWYARDFSAVASDKQGSVSSDRVGFDAFLKGGGFSLFGKRMSLSYLFFLANEQLDLGSEKTGDQVYTISLPIPYAGTGVSMTW
jgi:hypothetical protein